MATIRGVTSPVAGTGGIAGAVDTLWQLKRRPEGDATLDVVGRETEERTLALRFDREPLGWRVLGDDIVLGTGQKQRLVEYGRECCRDRRPLVAALRKGKRTRLIIDTAPAGRMILPQQVAAIRAIRNQFDRWGSFRFAFGDYIADIRKVPVHLTEDVAAALAAVVKSKPAGTDAAPAAGAATAIPAS